MSRIEEIKKRIEPKQINCQCQGGFAGTTITLPTLDDANWLIQEHARLAEKAEKAESQRDRMREALKKYGRHGQWCRFFEDEVIDCQCGLSRVLKEVGDE